MKELADLLWPRVMRDKRIEPDLDDNQDFSRCQELVKQKRFPWDQEACPDFDPVDVTDEDIPLSPELSSAIEQLARDGELTAKTLELAILGDIVDKIDWANMPVEQYIERRLVSLDNCGDMHFGK